MRAWWLFVRVAFRAELQYRANLTVAIIGGFIYQTIALATIGVILARYGTVGGWGLREIAFLYGMRLTAHGVTMVYLQPLATFDAAVREGDIDRYLIRPAGLLTQAVTQRAPIIALGDLLGGVVVLGVAIATAPVQLGAASFFYLVLAVLGGALIEAAFQIGASGLAFRLMFTLRLKVLIDSIFNTFGNYPMMIFGHGMQFVLTFVFPIAFVAYLPATVLLDRTGELTVPRWLGLGSPLVGALLFAVAYAFWRRQASHYCSTGH